MKTEVTMLPNTSRATMPPAAHPANDAEPRIAPASVRLRRLHARTWTGVSAELFEMHAADRSLVELPSESDGGRRVNNFEPDWPDSLQGFAKRAYDYYRTHLSPAEYRLRAQILEYPNGKFGDVGVFLCW